MVNLRRLEKKLEAKGINNTEVTRKGKDYYVLHILRNGRPVPLFQTEDKAKLLAYLDVHYDIGLPEATTK
ncbi:hypothetical protein MUP77_14745 [Candidatus Bathyarchaeota archaeon]|nr:hypothetical protein [Candidatus Bathyarchaeota archaeon]